MPRKSTMVSLTAAYEAEEAQRVADGIEGIEAYLLPKSIVLAIAKSSLSKMNPKGRIDRDAVTGLVRGSTVFVNYLAAAAHDVTRSHNRSKIQASDVLEALDVLKFGSIRSRLEQELERYRELQKESREANYDSTEGCEE